MLESVCWCISHALSMIYRRVRFVTSQVLLSVSTLPTVLPIQTPQHSLYQQLESIGNQMKMVRRPHAESLTWHVATCGLNSLKNLDRRGFLALQNYCGENTLLAPFWSYIWNFDKRNPSLSEFHIHPFLQQVAWRSNSATPFCNKGNLKRFTTCKIYAQWDLNLESTFINRISGSEILCMGLAWYHVNTIVIRIF